MFAFSCLVAKLQVVLLEIRYKLLACFVNLGSIVHFKWSLERLYLLVKYAYAKATHAAFFIVWLMKVYKTSLVFRIWDMILARDQRKVKQGPMEIISFHYT